MRPNGTAYGQGNSIQMSAEGMAERGGSGVGTTTGPGRGSMPIAVSIQLLHRRNGRDCLMFTPQANMKMTLTGITSGNSGNGNSDILKAPITRNDHQPFIPISISV
jgi:hypothetical protein